VVRKVTVFGFASLVFLSMMLGTLIPRAESATLFAMYGDSTRSGDNTMSEGGGVCPSSCTAVDIPSTQLYISASNVMGLDLIYTINQSFLSFDLDGVTGVPTAAEVKLVVFKKDNDDWNTDILVYVGDCCYPSGGPCTDPFTCADTSSCTELMTTVNWGDIPAVGDTLTITVPTEYVNPGAGHTLDLYMKSAQQADLCAATEENWVAFVNCTYTGGAHGPDEWARLYVTTTPAETKTPSRSTLFSALRTLMNGKIHMGEPHVIHYLE